MLPRSVTHGGKVRSRRGRLGEEDRPDLTRALDLAGRTLGPDLWDLRSTNNPLPRRSKYTASRRRYSGRGGTRTPTSSRTLDPEPSASTYSATRP